MSQCLFYPSTVQAQPWVSRGNVPWQRGAPRAAINNAWKESLLRGEVREGLLKADTHLGKALFVKARSSEPVIDSALNKLTRFLVQTTKSSIFRNIGHFVGQPSPEQIQKGMALPFVVDRTLIITGGVLAAAVAVLYVNQRWITPFVGHKIAHWLDHQTE